MWNRICCLFLLATAVTFYAAARLTGDLHVFFILEDERGYGDLTIQDICRKADLPHRIVLKPLSCWFPVIKHPIRAPAQIPGLVFHLTGTGQDQYMHICTA